MHTQQGSVKIEGGDNTQAHTLTHTADRAKGEKEDCRK